MVKNAGRLERFLESRTGKEKLSYRKALLIFEALYREAVTLGAIRPANILEGLEVDLRIAEAIHSLK